MAAGVLTQEILDRVRVRIAEPTAGMITDAEIADFITEAQRDLLWQLPYQALWPCIAEENTALVIGDDDYDFEGVGGAAPGFVREIYVKYKVVYALRIEAEDLGHLDSIAKMAPSETKPCYTIYTSGIIFFVGVGLPTAGSFDILYVKQPADISIGVAPVEPTFTQPYFSIIEDFVTARCWGQRGETDERNIAMGSYQNKIQRVIMQYLPGKDIAKYQAPGVRP